MIGKSAGLLGIALAVFTLAGCTKSDSGSSSSGTSSSGGGNASGVENEAQAAAMAELQKHWVKGPDGWTTARMTGSAYAPDHFIRQMRDLAVQGVQSYQLSDSDHLNGIDWAGEVTFKSAPCREAGDPGFLLDGMSNLGVNVNRQRGRWSQWVDFQPDSVHLHKSKGQWQFEQDTWLLRGALPTPQDYSNAGVK